MEKMGCRAPVVVITAYGSKDVETALRRHANVTLLRKPFGAELVATTVEEARSAFQRKNDNSHSV
jgi:FixJ family two-component response regulator